MGSGRGCSSIACDLRNDRGKIATGAVATDGNPGGIGAEFSSVVHGPREGGDGIVDSSGEWVLRCQPVVDREYVHVGVTGEQPAWLVVTFEIADDPPATVKKDQQGSVS